jgi:hypothetical protein
MDVPPYLRGQGEFAQENYQEELNQTIGDCLSNNGWTVPQITNANLTVNAVEWPDGTLATPAVFMPNGSLWYVTDGAPEVLVVKVAGALRRVSTTAYP